MSPRAPAAFLEHAQPFLKAGVLDASDVHAIALTAPRFGEDDVERIRAGYLARAAADPARFARIDADRYQGEFERGQLVLQGLNKY